MVETMLICFVLQSFCTLENRKQNIYSTGRHLHSTDYANSIIVEVAKCLFIFFIASIH